MKKANQVIAFSFWLNSWLKNHLPNTFFFGPTKKLKDKSQPKSRHPFPNYWKSLYVFNCVFGKLKMLGLDFTESSFLFYHLVVLLFYKWDRLNCNRNTLMSNTITLWEKLIVHFLQNAWAFRKTIWLHAKTIHKEAIL